MEDLADQIREDYLISVKKAIVDFVLKDHRELSVTGLDDEAKSSIYPPKDPHFTAVFKSSKAFCEEKEGRLIDADLFDELKIKIKDEKGGKEGFKNNQMFSFGELNVLLDIIYNFETKQWKNGITKSLLNETMWFFQPNTLPIYPVLNDLLGKTAWQQKQSCFMHNEIKPKI